MIIPSFLIHFFRLPTDCLTHPRPQSKLITLKMRWSFSSLLLIGASMPSRSMLTSHRLHNSFSSHLLSQISINIFLFSLINSFYRRRHQIHAGCWLLSVRHIMRAPSTSYWNVSIALRRNQTVCSLMRMSNQTVCSLMRISSTKRKQRKC